MRAMREREKSDESDERDESLEEHINMSVDMRMTLNSMMRIHR